MMTRLLAMAIFLSVAPFAAAVPANPLYRMFPDDIAGRWRGRSAEWAAGVRDG